MAFMHSMISCFPCTWTVISHLRQACLLGAAFDLFETDRLQFRHQARRPVSIEHDMRRLSIEALDHE